MKQLEKLFLKRGLEPTEETMALILNNTKTIKIPSKVEAKLEYFSDEDLLSVHSEKIIAKELILYLLGDFSDTFILSRESLNKRTELGYKSLSSKHFKEKVKVGNKSNYKIILDLLIKYEIIEKGRNYIASSRCNEYRLTDRYFGKGIVEYKLKTNLLKKRHFKFEEENLKKVLDCPIATNELLNRHLLTFPTQEEARQHLKNLSKEGTKNKKGKRVMFYSEVDPHDYNDYVYAEDYLLILDYLSKLTVPIVVSERGGGRVITAYNFLPSVLRKMVKVNGEYLEEVDYPCLHPNIINTIYKGSDNTITHDIVSKYLGISRQKAKVEHLSFFNKTWEKMSKSPLFEYYTKNEESMMVRLFHDKKEKGYKSTSQICFEFETEMQRTTVKNLREKGIRCFYVFDALVGSKEDIETIREEMNNTAKTFNVKIKC